jgi:hypothetical protein
MMSGTRGATPFDGLPEENLRPIPTHPASSTFGAKVSREESAFREGIFDKTSVRQASDAPPPASPPPPPLLLYLPPAGLA